MPFIFRDQSGMIHHLSRCSNEEWEAYKNGWRALGLRMACCDTHAVFVDLPQYRTRFVRHHPGEDCGSERESLEHQAIKAAAAVAAQAAGWTVHIEGGGTAPGGQIWRADVLCSRGAERVAIEIQMSRQSLADYRRRQEIYSASGVRGIWFAGHKGAASNPSTADLPIFPIRVEDLKADVKPSRGQNWLPAGRFVTELLDGRWHCREPILAPAAIIPEVAVCMDCGRQVLAGRTIAAYPAEADPVYPPGPIFAYLSHVLLDDPSGGSLMKTAWDKHRIVAITDGVGDCPYCRGWLASSPSFTLEKLRQARHGISDRHGSLLLVAGGWWRKGIPLVPRNWERPAALPAGEDVSIDVIIERQRRRLTDLHRDPLLQRERALNAIRSAIDGLSDWEAEMECWGHANDRQGTPWVADLVLREVGADSRSRRIAFFLALGDHALESRRAHAERAMRCGHEVVLLNPAMRERAAAGRPLEVPFSCGCDPVVVIDNEQVALTHFAASLVREELAIRHSVKVPFSLAPVPSHCPSCGRMGSMNGFIALHFAEADPIFGDAAVIMPMTPSWRYGGEATLVGRWSDAAGSQTCLCDESMMRSLPIDALLAGYGDVQVRHGRLDCSVGPLVRRGSVPLPSGAIGKAAGKRVWTGDDWLAHAESIAPLAMSGATWMRRTLLDDIRRGAEATGWDVDTTHADQGVVLVNSRLGSHLGIAFLSTIPGPWAEQRQDVEARAVDAVLRKAGVEETYWFTVTSNPTLARRHERAPILIGWQDHAAFALPAPDDAVPLARFVTDLLEGGWEYLRQQPLALSLVPERVRCMTCGKTSYIAPWCAAKAAGRLAPSFARILGQPDDKMRLLPFETAETLRRTAERQLRMPSFEKHGRAVVQCCGHCGRMLASVLTTETLRRHWTGIGVGRLETSIDLHRWCRRAEPILAGSLTVSGRLDASRLTLEQWLSVIAPQEPLP